MLALLSSSLASIWLQCRIYLASFEKFNLATLIKAIVYLFLLVQLVSTMSKRRRHFNQSYEAAEREQTSKKLTTVHEEKEIVQAIYQNQKLTLSLERCEYCLDQSRNKKYLIVDIGEHVYLCLPNFQTLTDGHCLIVPKVHAASFLSLDENVWTEVNNFKNHLRNLFKTDKSVLFLETSMNRHLSHAVIECIPVPKEDSDMAPFYFKKAIEESETEWTHNKKLVDLTKKGLRLSIPKGLPYFHIEFDPTVHAGYAHVIEDEDNFPRNFGKEVVGGILEIDYNYLYKNKKDNLTEKLKSVVKFEKNWRKVKSFS